MVDWFSEMLWATCSLQFCFTVVPSDLSWDKGRGTMLAVPQEGLAEITGNRIAMDMPSGAFLGANL